jgi:hypothetical protein
MSRAFVKEADNQAPDLPDRPISPHRNFVTPEGLGAIEGALVRFEAAHRAAIDNGDQAGCGIRSEGSPILACTAVER